MYQPEGARPGAPRPSHNVRILGDEEPRGEPWGEPREDGLVFDPQTKGWHREDGRKVCGSRRGGGRWHNGYLRCRQHTTKANGRCQHHGGESLKGAAQPRYKSGKYSKYLPRDLRERHEAFASDREISDLRETIALLDTRISEVLEGIDVGASAKRFERVTERVEEMMDATADLQGAIYAMAEDAGADLPPAVRAAAERLEDASGRLQHELDTGRRDREAWSEVTDLVAERRKVSRAELQRVVKSEQIVDVEEAVNIMSTLADTVHRLIEMHVPAAEQSKAKAYMQQSVNAIYRGDTAGAA